MAKVIVMIPALNEELAIGQTVKEIKQLILDCKIVVVDSDSTDATATIARNEGIEVINTPKGGKGVAVRYALEQLLGDDMLYFIPYLIMMDGDYTYPAHHLDAILQALMDGADVVIGYRHKRALGSMTRMNAIGNKALSLLASLLYGYWVKDVCSGMWGFRTQALRGFTITSKRFTLEADLFVNARKRGCRIVQVPINYRARLSGSTAKLRVSDGIKIGWFLIQRRA
jgi:dolichol-phosphate mannosyltransferase